MKFFRKYHKWLGVIFALFLILFSLSGIVLNHRDLFAGIDVNRYLMPNEYHYNGWNNAAVRGSVKLNKDSVLIYGNIGVWLSDTSAKKFNDFNQGLPKGIDNRKICKIYKTKQGKLLAGTLLGLYYYDFNKQKWQKINFLSPEKRVVDITEKQDTVLLLTRSFLFKTTDFKNFSKIILPQPENYDNKEGLFKTLWIIHSGEIYGHIGKLLVDFVGFIFIFLSITGIIYFVNKYRIKNRQKKHKKALNLININLWNIKWHNKIGWITLIFLLITTSTGMFLRPPLLIAIVEKQVGKIPFTILDTDNAWFDKLRRIEYFPEKKLFIVGTIKGFYFADENLKSKLKYINNQPIVSVMGINVFEKQDSETMIIGSFSGAYVWKPFNNKYKPAFSNTENFSITGFSKDFNNKEYFFDFDAHAFTTSGEKFPAMPEEIKNQAISLWNVALELHTGRLYKFMFGRLYILFIPIAGLSTLFILISGFIVWYKKWKQQ